jgi:hypothetical protein
VKRELLGLGIVVVACALLAGSHAMGTSHVGDRFEVEVFTQGDSIWDDSRQQYLEHETATVKAARSVTMKYRRTIPISQDLTFVWPPWTGQHGTEYPHPDASSSGGGFYRREQFVHGSSGLSGPKDPTGRYALTPPQWNLL